MDITELGAIGELVGGVAVIGSLLFVGVQLRANTREQKIASIQEATRENSKTAQNLATPGFAEIWLLGLRDFQALPPADRLRLSAVLVQQTRMFEGLYHQFLGRDETNEQWLGFERQLRDIAAYPGFQGWWVDRGHWFSDSFRALVDSQIQAGNPLRLYETWEPEV